MGLKVSSKRFVLSDETKNLYGFITITAGIDLTAFNENPVMLYNHDYDKLIGQWTDWKVEGNKLTAVPAFDENDPDAMLQYSKVEDGILKGASIGISPISFDEAKGEMSASLLLEASLTPVPNNRKALAIYDAKGKKLNAGEIKQYLLSVERTDPPINKNQNMNDKLISALVALCALAGHTISLSATSTDDDLLNAITKAGGKITELTGKVLVLETQAKTAAEHEVETLVDAAIAQKRLSASDKQAFVDFGKTNLSALKTTLSALNPVKMEVIPGAAAAAATPAAGADEKANWTFDDFALKAPSELERMQGAEPERFMKLLSAKQSAVRSTGAVAV